MSSYMSPSLYSSAALSILRTVTPVHAGVGRVIGAVDLPIQRDEYGFPAIYSSSIKGTLKTALIYSYMKRVKSSYEEARNAVKVLLGPEPGEAETFESSIAILDAYTLAFPVRSLKGVYVYVTSPTLLSRLCDRLELLTSLQGWRESREVKGGNEGIKDIRKCIRGLENILKDKRDKVVCVDERRCTISCKDIRVEELRGKIVLVEEVFLEEIGSEKAEHLDKTPLSRLVEVLNLDRPLLVLNDDTARDVIERSIIRYTRVRLRRETKTVGEGPWTEEYLPPKTILHTLLLFKRPPLTSNFIKQVIGKDGQEVSDEDYLEALSKLKVLRENSKNEILRESNPLGRSMKIAEALKNTLKDLIGALGGYLILGGLETIGRGIVRLELIQDEDVGKLITGGGQ